MKDTLRISVRSLVEFVMRSGDIDTGFFSNNRALKGIEAHKKIQSQYGENFKKEVKVSCLESIEDIDILVEGRIDGIYLGDRVLIDEIKSTTRELNDLDYETNIMHWAQAKSYGYMYARENFLDEIDVQITYFNIDTEEIKIIKESFKFSELEKFFKEILMKYLDFSKRLVEWNKVRNKSISEMKFPFKSYRKGQRKLSVGTYRTIEEGKNLFVEAPTGIGKSISTIFPAIKSIGTELIDKIFYLTGRGTQKKAAEDTVFNLIDRNLQIKHLIITAKDKICINDEVKCNPVDCPYAKGHFDRVNDAIIDLFDSENEYKKETIEKFARLHMVCPFEFQLDMAMFSDMITCDYNYVFDPQVYLRRFFDNEVSRYCFLIDEAHNLIDRGRNMYSTELFENSLVKLVDYISEDYNAIKKAAIKAVENVQDLKNTKLKYRPRIYEKEKPEKLIDSLIRLINKMEVYLVEGKKEEKYDEVLEIYFEINKFLKIGEYYSDSFVTVYSKDEEMKIKLLCLNTQEIFSEILKVAKASVFFSATLTPINYYQKLLGGSESDYLMKIESPFDSKNELVIHGDLISVKYKNREKSIDKIVEYLRVLTEKDGNYIFFFPSYVYMEQVYEEYKKYDENTIIQRSNMNEEERQEFVGKFKFNESIRGFAVMGGVFSEGIDLIGERLIGAAIISVGIPQISYERSILRDYFNNKYNRGYEYAYIYPGIMKTIQSAGRVIRSPEDRGVVLLIDDRFGEETYKKLLPKNWNVKRVISKVQLKESIHDFWANDN